MSLMSEIRNTLCDLKPRIVMHGKRKVGKTTFASRTPKPILIATEDGQDAVSMPAFPLCKEMNDVRECLKALYKEKHDYQTVVIDSLDWLEPLAISELCKKFKKDSIEDFGYGKGYVFVADIVREVLSGLNLLRKERNMNVLLIAHTEIKTFNDPLTESYDRYQMKLSRHVGKIVDEWADVIAFVDIMLETKSTSAGFDKTRVRAVSNGERVMNLNPSPSYDAGNRYGLPSVLPLDWDTFEEALQQARRNNVTTEQKETVTDLVTEEQE